VGGGGGGSTQNDVQPGKCATTTLQFARGTTELGNMGTVVGPPLATALKSLLNGDVAVQGANYRADFAGAASGSLNPAGADGAKDMIAMAQKAVAACPDTQIALAGYSQGAEQVHGAFIGMDAATKANVKVCFAVLLI
jgi:cutinase